MPQNTKHEKVHDFFSMGGISRQIERAVPTCRMYARMLYAENTAGIFRLDSGELIADARGIEALRKLSAARAAEKRGG